MADKVARAVKHDALNMEAAKGAKQEDIADSLVICSRTIRRARSELHKYGDIKGGKKKAGRKPKITSKSSNRRCTDFHISSTIRLLRPLPPTTRLLRALRPAQLIELQNEYSTLRARIRVRRI